MAGMPAPTWRSVNATYKLHLKVGCGHGNLVSYVWITSDYGDPKKTITCHLGKEIKVSLREVKLQELVYVDVWETVKTEGGEKVRSHMGVSCFSSFPHEDCEVQIIRGGTNTGSVCVVSSQFRVGDTPLDLCPAGNDLNVHFYRAWIDGHYQACPWWRFVNEKYFPDLSPGENTTIEEVFQGKGLEDIEYATNLNTLLDRLRPPYLFDCVGTDPIEDPCRTPIAGTGEIKWGGDCEDTAGMFFRMILLSPRLNNYVPLFVLCTSAGPAVEGVRGSSGHATVVLVKRGEVGKFLKGGGSKVLVAEGTGRLHPYVFHGEDKDQKDRARGFYREVITVTFSDGRMYNAERNCGFEKMCRGECIFEQTVTLKSGGPPAFFPFRRGEVVDPQRQRRRRRRRGRGQKPAAAGPS